MPAMEAPSGDTRRTLPWINLDQPQYDQSTYTGMGLTLLFLSRLYQMPAMEASAGRDTQGSLPRISLDQPRYDQSTYVGRAKHFFITTNPLNLLKTGAELERAKQIVQAYRYNVLS